MEEFQVKLGRARIWSNIDRDLLKTVLNEYGYVGSTKDLLQIWEEEKKQLLDLFGGHTVEVSIEFVETDNDRLRNAIKPIISDLLPVDLLSNYTWSEWACGRAQDGAKICKAVAKQLHERGWSEKNIERFKQVYSRVLGQLKVKGWLRLSCAPEELLLIADSTTGWSSCHSIGGDHARGNFAYLADKHTVVAYYYKKKARWRGFELPQKKWRALFYVDVPNRSCLQSRQFPAQREPLAFAARRLLFSFFAEREGVKNERTRGGEYSLEVFSPNAYVDAHSAGYRLIVRLKEGGKAPQIRIPDETAIFDLAPKYFCSLCNEEIRGDVFHDPSGAPVCEYCFSSHCCYCDDCGATIWHEDSNYVCDEYVCSYCFSEHCFICPCCEEAWWIDDSRSSPGGGQICIDCYNEHVARCRRCNTEYWQDDLTEGLCPDCLA